MPPEGVEVVATPLGVALAQVQQNEEPCGCGEILRTAMSWRFIIGVDVDDAWKYPRLMLIHSFGCVAISYFLEPWPRRKAWVGWKVRLSPVSLLFFACRITL